MKELYPLSGIVTVLNTPFSADESIDFQAQKRNVNEAMKAGVAGFLVTVMASEVYSLSETGRIQMVEAFRCHKIETVPSGVKYSRKPELTGGRLNVSSGWAVSRMIEGMNRGVHAFMYIYTYICRLFDAGNEEEAESLFYNMLPVLAFSNQHLDRSIHFFKRLLYRQGIYPAILVRKNTLLFDEIHRKMADRHIDYIIQLENT